jgi:CHAD domain-containing protein
MITQNSYSENLEKAEKDARFILESYLKEPTAENLHGLRTSTRRMLTILKLLPAKVREDKSKGQIDKFSRLLRLTQKARHLDIVLARIPSIEQNRATETLVKGFRRARDTSLRTAQHIASSLKDIQFPEIRTRDLEDSTLQKRFNRSTEKLTAKIQKALPAVTKYSIKPKQLRRLRQDARKLRYLLELSPNPETSEKLSALKSWQELLATIHDNDACIQLLQEGKKSAQIEGLVRELTSERSQNFEKFKSMVEEKPVFLKV